MQSINESGFKNLDLKKTQPFGLYWVFLFMVVKFIVLSKHKEIKWGENLVGFYHFFHRVQPKNYSVSFRSILLRPDWHNSTHKCCLLCRIISFLQWYEICIDYYKVQREYGVVVRTSDLQPRGQRFESRPLRFTNEPVQVVHTHVPLFTKQYKLVPAKGQ